jgi:exodeoxyribonuclease-3
MTLRLMTWNIKTGGVDRGRGDRLDAIVRVVVRQAPDVLALQELRDFDRDGHRRMWEVADAVGMTPHLARSAFGQPVGVLVRPPGVTLSTRAVRWRLHHAAAAVDVLTDRGPLTVVSTHLNPFSPYRRMREARWLAARYASATRAVVVAGDLNALDPWTDHAERLARLPPLYRRRHLGPDGSADTRTVSAFDAAGFADLWRVAGTGAGLTAPTTGGGGREFSGMRLDYMLGSPPVAAVTRDCRVVRGDESEYASDHYAAVADLDMSLSAGGGRPGSSGQRGGGSGARRS